MTQSQIVVSVDDDGTVLVAIPPSRFPLADMVTRALGAAKDRHHEPPGVEPVPDFEAEQPTTSQEDIDALVEDENDAAQVVSSLQHRILKWLRTQPDGAAPREITKAVKAHGENVRKTLQRMSASGLVEATGSTRNRRYRVAP